MRGPSQDKLWYKIVLIELDLSCDQLCNYIIIQLFFFLDTSSNKRVAFEIMTLIGKSFLNSIEN